MKFIAVYDEDSPCERDFEILNGFGAVEAHRGIHVYGRQYWTYYVLGEELDESPER